MSCELDWEGAEWTRWCLEREKWTTGMEKYFVCFEFGLQVVYGLVKTIVTSLMFEPS